MTNIKQLLLTLEQTWRIREQTPPPIQRSIVGYWPALNTRDNLKELQSVYWLFIGPRQLWAYFEALSTIS